MKRLFIICGIIASTILQFDCRGPEGKIGPRGFQGSQGLIGPQGDEGPTGPQGVSGNANVMLYKYGPKTWTDFTTLPHSGYANIKIGFKPRPLLLWY